MPRLDAIGVIVSDMERAVAFYARLGLEFASEAEGGAGHREAELPGGMRLMIDTEEVIGSFNPDWTPPQGGPRVGLAFLCESPADVDRLHGELLAAGAGERKAPWDAFWGQCYAQVGDPDGNLIDLFAALDG